MQARARFDVAALCALTMLRLVKPENLEDCKVDIAAYNGGTNLRKGDSVFDG